VSPYLMATVYAGWEIESKRLYFWKRPM